MINPLDGFFKLGDKVSEGDPIRKAKFDYYLLWVIFIAFASIGISHLYYFFNDGNFVRLGWALVMVGILWFQYFGLRQTRKMIKLQQNMKNMSATTLKEDKVSDMLKTFK